MATDIALLSLASGRGLAGRVAQTLGLSPSPHEERDFGDGEHKIRPLASVRGRDVYVIQSLHGDGQHSVDDQLVRLLFFLATLRDVGAARTTAVIPYLCYARKDRRTQPRDPVTTRYLAQLFEAMGIDRLVTVDAHNPAALQNAFRCPTEHLSARTALIDHLQPLLAGQALCVASPDIGGVKRSETFRMVLSQRLGQPASAAFVEKHRSGGQVSGDLVAGEVAGRTVLLVDDLIASGGTLARAAGALRARGAVRVMAVASHGVFSADAATVLATPALDHIAVSNSLPLADDITGALAAKLAVVDIAPLLAQAIHGLHTGESIGEWLAE